MKVKYMGPFDAVIVAGVEAKRGEPIEVDDVLGSSLLEQEDNWRAASSRKHATSEEG